MLTTFSSPDLIWDCILTCDNFLLKKILLNKIYHKQERSCKQSEKEGCFMIVCGQEQKIYQFISNKTGHKYWVQMSFQGSMLYNCKLKSFCLSL